MPFTLDETIAGAMHVLGQGASTRYPPERMLVHANNAILRLAEAKPELFAENVWNPTAAGTVEQAYSTRQIVNVTAVRLGTDERGLLPLDVLTLSAWDPKWRAAAPDVPRQASVIDRDRFILYPPPKEGVQALIRHVKVPTGYAADATVPLPRSFLPPLTDYVTGMAEFADEEHVNSMRAAQLLQAFFVAVGVRQPAQPQGAPRGNAQ